MRDKLTPKGWVFALEYAVDLNGAAAARRAGDSRRTAKVIADRLLKIPAVRQGVRRRVQAKLQ